MSGNSSSIEKSPIKPPVLNPDAFCPHCGERFVYSEEDEVYYGVKSRNRFGEPEDWDDHVPHCDSPNVKQAAEVATMMSYPSPPEDLVNWFATIESELEAGIAEAHRTGKAATLFELMDVIYEKHKDISGKYFFYGGAYFQTLAMHRMETGVITKRGLKDGAR